MYGPYKLFFDASLLYDISKLVASNPIMKIKLCKFVSLFLHLTPFLLILITCYNFYIRKRRQTDEPYSC